LCRKGIAILPELNRLRRVLSYCNNFNIDEAKEAKSNGQNKFEQLQDAPKDTSPRLNEEANLTNNEDYRGLMSNLEKHKESLLYI
jgi:hypothetical protein